MILGAKGQLGRQIVARLAQSARWESIPCDLPDLDITDAPATRQMIETTRPVWVINCAANTDVQRCETDPSTNAVNADAVANLAEVCQQTNSRLLQISTDYVFDGKASRPYREQDAPGPVNVYARAKLLAERFAQACDRYLIVRTAWLFGPGGRNFVATILADAKAGVPLQVVNDQTGNPSYAPDMAECIERLMRLEAEGIFHIVNAGQATWYDLACKAVELSGWDVPVVPITTAECPSPVARPAYTVLDCGKYMAASGHRSRPWQMALTDYVHGFFSNPR